MVAQKVDFAEYKNAGIWQLATEVFPIPSNDVIRKFVRRHVTKLDTAFSIFLSAETSTLASQTQAAAVGSTDISSAEYTVAKSVDLQQELKAAMFQLVQALTSASQNVSLLSQMLKESWIHP